MEYKLVPAEQSHEEFSDLAYGELFMWLHINFSKNHCSGLCMKITHVGTSKIQSTGYMYLTGLRVGECFTTYCAGAVVTYTATAPLSIEQVMK